MSYTAKKNYRQEGEADLIRLVGSLWENKVLIIILTVISVAIACLYLVKTPRIYQADLLLQVDKKSSGISLLGGISNLLGDDIDSSGGESELIKSRMILTKIIDKFNLDMSLVPLDNQKALPHSQYHLKLKLQEPRVFNELTIHVSKNGQVRLFDQDSLLISTTVGHIAQKDGLTFLLDSKNILEEGSYQLKLGSKYQIIEQLRRQLSISEQGKNTGFFELRMTDKNPTQAVNMLNAVAKEYLLYNSNKNTIEISQTIDFINKKIPDIEEKLVAAEAAMTNFLSKRKVVDLDTTSSTQVRELAKLDAEIQLLNLKEKQLSKRFTTSHPAYVTLIQQRKLLAKNKQKLERSFTALPKAQQKIISLKRNIVTYQEIYTQLLSKLQELRVLKASTVSGVRIIDQATANPTPIHPRSSMVLLISLLLGFSLGVAVILIKNLFKNAIDEITDITINTNLPVFAIIPETAKQKVIGKKIKKTKGHMGMHSILANSQSDDPSIEAIRGIRTNLFFAVQEADNNLCMITSPAPEAGKSFISSNLAVLLASNEQKIALLNLDLRRGYLDRLFELQGDKVSLIDYLQSQELMPSQCLHSTSINNLDYVPIGHYPANPSELLLSKKFVELLAFLNENYDVVILDSPPVLPVTDASIIGKYAATSLMVVKAEKTTVGELTAACEKLENNHIKISGVILNGAKKRMNRYHYNYRY